MALDFQQTDTDGSLGAGNAYCSAGMRSLGQKVASNGGSAGSVEISPSLSGSDSNRGFFRLDIPIDATVSWDAGDWTIRLSVTTSNMNITWESVYICRVNSSDVNQETLGSSTSLAISLGSTGVKSTTVTGTGTTPGAGDKVVIVFSGTNGAMTSQNFGITPSQIISSPFTDSAAPTGQPTMRRWGGIPGMNHYTGRGNW